MSDRFDRTSATQKLTASDKTPSDKKHWQTVELESGPNQRLQVELARDAVGKRELVLRELSWGNGVGWFTQKSIHLDSRQIDSLLKALCCLRATGQAPPCISGSSTGSSCAGAAETGRGRAAGTIVQVEFAGPPRD